MPVITLSTDSLYEMFLSTLGWIMANRAWNLMVDTGVFALPFIFNLLSLLMKVRAQGADEGSKGQLLTNWLENYFYTALFILVLTCQPVFTVNFKPVEMVDDKTCGKYTVKPEETSLGQSFTTLNNERVVMPLWWATVYTIGKGFSNALQQSIPCSPDVRKISTELASKVITDPVVKQEVAQFREQCYLKARDAFVRDYRRKGNEISLHLNEKINWLGSSTLWKGGYYKDFHADNPNPHFEYIAEKHATICGNEKCDPSNGGFPTCDEWWNDSGRGLYDRLYAQYGEQQLKEMKNIKRYQRMPEEQRKAMLVKALIEPQKIASTDGANIYGTGYDKDMNRITNQSSFWASLLDGVKQALSGAGMVAGNALMAPVFDSIKQALPIVQAIIGSMIIVVTPFVSVMSGYKSKPIIVMTFTFFGLWFLSYIWRLLHWIDSYLFEALQQLNGDATVLDNMTILHTTSSFVIGAMYLILPVVVFTAMGWAGIQTGDFISSALNQSTNKVGQSGGMIGNFASSTTKGIASEKITRTVNKFNK